MKGQGIWRKAAGALLVPCLMLGSLALPSMAQESQQQPPTEIKWKSEKRALGLSLTFTLASYVLAAASLKCAPLGFFGLAAGLVGPSLGYFYAGLTGRGLAGVGIRLAGIAVPLFLADALGWSWDDNSAGVAVVLVAGGCAVLASTIWDLAGVKQAVRKRNDRIQKVSLSVAPVLAPKSKTVGLSLRLGF